MTTTRIDPHPPTAPSGPLPSAQEPLAAEPAMHPLIRHRGRAALTGAVLLGAGTALGLWVTAAGPQRTGELQLDQTLAAHRDLPLTAAARFIDLALSPLGALVLLFAICLAVALRRRLAAAVLFATTITGWFSVGADKILFARPRPSADAVHALVQENGLDSFPSGHTGFAVALLAGILLSLRISGRSTRLAWLVGVPAVAVVALSRLYLGAHFLGDVVASPLFVTGTVLLLAAWASPLLTGRQPVEGIAQAIPPQR